MKQERFFMCRMVMACVVFTLCVSSCAEKHNTLTTDEIAAGWTLLFDGETLNGWRDYNGTGITAPWVVEDGTLASLEQAADGNSGVFFRSFIVRGVTITGWQCEVAPPERFIAGIYESVPGGRGWLIKPDLEKESILKMGEWNTMRLVMKGDHVTTG